MSGVFLLVAAAIVVALMLPPSKPPKVEAENPIEEAIETFVWRVHGIDIRPRDAICAETTMEKPVLNCLITVRDERNVKHDLRFWCAVDPNICVEEYETLFALIEAKEKEEFASEGAKRAAAISPN